MSRSRLSLYERVFQLEARQTFDVTFLYRLRYFDQRYSSFITPEGSKMSHKNTKIHKSTHTKYDTKLRISTHIHTIKQ